MLKRPSKNDSEEDILKFQEEFLSSKIKPAATIVKATEEKKTRCENDETYCKPNKVEKDVIDLGSINGTFFSLHINTSKLIFSRHGFC